MTYTNPHLDYNRTANNPAPIPCPWRFSTAGPPTTTNPRTDSAPNRLSRPSSSRSPGAAGAASNPEHSRTAVRPSENYIEVRVDSDSNRVVGVSRCRMGFLG